MAATRTLDRVVWSLVAAGAACHVVLLVLSAAPLLPTGPWGFDLMDVALFFASLLIAAATLLAGIVALAKRRFALAAAATLLASTIVVLWVPTHWLGHQARLFAFSVVVQRAGPLVAAVHEHQKQLGKPPATIDDLVPRFIDKIPSGLPPLEVIASSAGMWHFKCSQGSWALLAWVPTGWFNIDRIVYLDTKEYADCSRSHKVRSVDRVGEWVYIRADD